MSIGYPLVTTDTLPLMSEADARQTLAESRRIYNVPTEWDADTHNVVVFTGDVVEAALCADVISRQDIGVAYRAYAGGGVDVVGPIEVVLVGIPGTEFIDWRPTADVFTAPPCDDDERARRWSLLMCIVRPAREQASELYTDLVTTGELR